MKIVFLDHGSFQERHESFDYSLFRDVGSLNLLHVQSVEEAAERASDADVIIVCRMPVTPELIDQLGNLKIICQAGSSLARIAVEYAAERGITCVRAPGYAVEGVAQWTMTLILALTGHLIPYGNAVKNGEWTRSQFRHPISTLRNKVLGIVGYGHIGQAVARLAMVHGMKVQVYDRYLSEHFDDFVEFMPAHKLLSQADVISLHCNFVEGNRHMISFDEIAIMRPGVFLVNTADAALLDKAAIVDALQHYQLGGFAMDGYWQEPAGIDSLVMDYENVIITPHVAWSSHASRQELLNRMARGLREAVEAESALTA